jgi:hypothetical protein
VVEYLAVKTVKFISFFLSVVLLTALTQIGGAVFLLSILLHKIIDRKISGSVGRFLAKTVAFSAIYLVFVFALVPLIAKPLGRQQLPLLETSHVKPARVFFFLLNRNYVNPELKKIIFDVAAANE